MTNKAIKRTPTCHKIGPDEWLVRGFAFVGYINKSCQGDFIFAARHAHEEIRAEAGPYATMPEALADCRRFYGDPENVRPTLPDWRDWNAFHAIDRTKAVQS